MIVYHGTPIGGDNLNAQKFLKGKHALVSFAHQGQMEIVARVCSSFVLDNGAYSAWKKGCEIDFEAYVEWVKKWHMHPGFDWAIIPDVISGTETENDELLAMWPRGVEGVPVYHINESIDRLVRLSQNYPRIALGSSALYNSRQAFFQRMNIIMNAICDNEGRPKCKIHGLRMLDPDIFTQLPLSSADSTNAARNNNLLSRHGQYSSKCDIWLRTLSIAESIEGFNSTALWKGTTPVDLFSFFGDLHKP